MGLSLTQSLPAVQMSCGGHQFPVVSIITVTFNNNDELLSTIENIKLQNYKNIEYIIVDGGSDDGTLETIKKYGSVVKRWISEPDAGIYDAMNKGIGLATGEWILFMNAGDRFFDDNVLSQVFSNKVSDDISVIYGDHEVRYPSKTVSRLAGVVSSLWRGSQFCHQSTLVRGDLLKINSFNLKYKLAADFEWLWRMRKVVKMQKLDLTISSVSSGGVSDMRRCEVYREFSEICANPISNAYFFGRCIVFKLKSIILP